MCVRMSCILLSVVVSASRVNITHVSYDTFDRSPRTSLNLQGYLAINVLLPTTHETFVHFSKERRQKSCQENRFASLIPCQSSVICEANVTGNTISKHSATLVWGLVPRLNYSPPGPLKLYIYFRWLARAYPNLMTTSPVVLRGKYENFRCTFHQYNIVMPKIIIMTLFKY